MNSLPQARNENIVIQESEKEILIYDLITHQAFCLNETAKIVFEACDGKTSVAEFKKTSGFTDDLIFLTLDGLQQQNLIESEHINYLGGLSRREIIRRVGLASLVMMPIITTIVVPTPVNAASPVIVICPPGSRRLFCVATPEDCSTRCGLGVLLAVFDEFAVGVCASNPPGLQVSCCCS